MADRTFVIIKPDAVERGLAGEIIARFERKGLRIVAMDLRTIDAETAGRHYAEHEGKPFYPELLDFIGRSPADHAGARGPGGHVEGGAHADGRHQPPRVGARARSGATSACCSPRTWSTAATAPSRPTREIGIFFPEPAGDRSAAMPRDVPPPDRVGSAAS